jgi:hypothetical protein
MLVSALLELEIIGCLLKPKPWIASRLDLSSAELTGWELGWHWDTGLVLVALGFGTGAGAGVGRAALGLLGRRPLLLMLLPICSGSTAFPASTFGFSYLLAAPMNNFR